MVIYGYKIRVGDENITYSICVYLVCRSFLFFLDNIECNDPNVGHCTFSEHRYLVKTFYRCECVRYVLLLSNKLVSYALE